MGTQVGPSGIDRHTRLKDSPNDPNGFRFRWTARGEKHWHGYIPGRGYVALGVMPKREARAMWDELRGKAGRGEKLPRRNMRFGPVAELWYESKQGRLRPWTLKEDRRALNNEILPRFGNRKLADISADDIVKFTRHLEAKGLSSSTVEHYLRPLKGTLALAVRRGLLSSNPCSVLTSEDRPKKDERRKAHEWSDAEIDALLEASESLARQPSARQDYSVLLRTAVRTGLRLGELVGLRWKDVDLEEGVVHVSWQLSRTGELTAPKTQKSIRRVPLSSELGALLRRHRLASNFSQPDDFIFPSRTGGPLSHRNVQRRAFEPARDLAGLPKTIRFHDLRHAFASYAAHRGVPLNLLSEILGHANIAVTAKVYVHLYGRDAAEEQFRVAMAQ